jgi:hypothetical protein
MTRRWRVRLAQAVALGATIAVASAVPGQGADEPPPGHPPLPPTGVGQEWLTAGWWSGATQSGISDVSRQRQWVRTGDLLMTAASPLWFESHRTAPAHPATELPEPEDPEAFARECPDEYKQCYVGGSLVNLVSPPGSPHNYGTSPEIVIRTVAFGAVPVEATIQLEQQRAADGTPESLLLRSPQVYLFRPGSNAAGVSKYYDSVLSAGLDVRVNRLVIDGRRVSFVGTCQTQEPARLRLRGKGYRTDDPNVRDPLWETGHFAAAKGGLLEGTLDVGGFGACPTTTGDDLAPLLTATVSGSGNTVRIHTTGPTGCSPLGFPPGTTAPPGTTIDQWREAGCTIPPAPDLPAAE